MAVADAAYRRSWLRVRRETRGAKDEAQVRFLAPMVQSLDHIGNGQSPEIAMEMPHTLRGCPFQSWSISEALRIELILR